MQLDVKLFISHFLFLFFFFFMSLVRSARFTEARSLRSMWGWRLYNRLQCVSVSLCRIC